MDNKVEKIIEEYWVKKLSGEIPNQVFPKKISNASEASKNYEFKYLVPENIGNELLKFGKDSDLSVHILMISALSVIISRYSESNTILLGSSSLKENNSSNLIIHKLSLENTNLRELITTVKETVLEDFNYSNYPFEKIFNILKKINKVDNLELFDLCFISQNIQNEIPLSYSYNLKINFVRNKNAISLTVNHNGLYDQKLITMFISHVFNIFDHFKANLSLPIAQIQILSEEEKGQLLFEFNNSTAELPKNKTFLQIFEEQVRITPDRIVAIHKDERITYKVLDERATFFAEYLLARGCKKNSKICVFLKRDINILTVIISIFKAGGIYIPIESEYPLVRAKDIINDSHSEILILEDFDVITKDTIANDLLSLKTTIKLNNNLFNNPERDCSYSDIKPILSCDDVAYIIYTSGTTGKPKGVMIHHLGMLNHLFAKINDLSITKEDTVTQTASICFDISIWQFLTASLTGGIVLIIDKDTILSFQKTFEVFSKEKITIFESVPSLMKLLLNEIPENNTFLKHLKWMLMTGEALDVSLVNKWFDVFPKIKLVNAYGPTEASDDITHYFLDRKLPVSEQNVPIGKSIQNLKVYVLNKGLSLCPIGIKGEICVSGIGVGKGYWNDKVKTDASFVSNPYLKDIEDQSHSLLYKTGDIGYYREDGNIICLGRKDDQIKIRGNRIEIQEIEYKIKKFEEIRDTVVMVRDDMGDKYLCAYYISNKIFDISSFKNNLARELPDYMMPSVFVEINEIPLSHNGKVDKKSLPIPQLVSIKEYLPPQNNTEKNLVKIWSDLLGIDEMTIGRDSDFFELGGHSLKATMLITKIHKELKVELQPSVIFEKSKLSDIAKEIYKSKLTEFIPIRNSEKKEYYCLSSTQERLYFIQQIDNTSIAYNSSFAAYLLGNFSIDKFQNALQVLIKRHEVLRTSFEMVGIKPVQRVHNSTKPFIKYQELKGNEKVDQLLKDFVKPYDLAYPPLFRILLLKESDNKHIILIDIHHIIADGTSLQILIEELVSIYGGIQLTPLNIQYKEYAEWLNRKTFQSKIKKQEEFWLNELKTPISQVNLPIDYTRPSVQSFDGEKIYFKIEEDIEDKLNEISKKEEVTIFMFLLAIYNIFISKITGGLSDVLIGTGIAGRKHEDVQRLIGMFVNTLVLRNTVTPSLSFSTFLKQIKKKTIAAYENQEYQFDDLVNKIAKQRKWNRNPIVDVVFVFQNMDLADIEEIVTDNLKIAPYPYQHDISKFDLSLYSEYKSDRLSFCIEYCTKLFKRETIENFISYFKNILITVVNDPQITINEIPDFEDKNQENILNYQFEF